MKNLQIRWHHFYVVLAAFDMLVILGGIALHHSALNGFRDLLDHFARFDHAERWVASLRQTLNEIGAAASDAGQSQDLAAQEARFHQLADTLLKERSQTIVAAPHMKRFWEHVDLMRQSEEDVFQLLRQTGQHARAGDSIVSKTAEANRHKAHALRQLEKEGGRLLADSASVQLGHQALAQRHELAEKTLALALLMNIGGMLWYRRKLQRTDEFLMSEQQRASAERRERLAAIGEICSGVAHGIQNPLAAIHSSAELIVDMGRIDGVTRQRGQDILAECDRLSSRVSRLLGFAKADSAPRRIVDVRHLLEDVAAELSSRFERGRVRPILSLCATAAPVHADPHELASVFIELVSNGLDHAPADTAIRMSCRLANATVEVDISDEGPGVPAARRDDVFKLFYTTRAGGSGVGLASAKRIAESLGGRLELIDSQTARGATFRVRLPLAEA